MQIIHSLQNKDKTPKILTIGNFDGIHIGHQAIINRLLYLSKKNNLSPAIMSFSPHPKRFFTNQKETLIYDEKKKQNILRSLQIKYYYLTKFDDEFARISANDFITILYKDLNIKYLIIGDDFRFGYQGQGDFNLLKNISNQGVFKLEQTKTIMHDGKRISSSRIRTAIKNSDFNLAKKLLGASYTFKGTVTYGKQIGRSIGFPTANFKVDENLLLPQGVFSVYSYIDGTKINGIANIGIKPTFQNNQRTLEVHYFDFESNLYNKEIEIYFKEKIRDEKKFNSIDDLKQQIQKDIKITKQE